MTFEVIRGPGVPESTLPFSPAVRAGGFVFVSGQASVDEAGNIVADTFEGELRRSFENVQKVLAGAGLDLSDVVRVTGYVAEKKYLSEYNELYKDYFKPPFPARSTLTDCLPEGVLKFELDVIALDRN